MYGALSYSLLRGVQELVLAAPAVTDPEARICPEAADCVHVASLQLVDVHCVDVLQPLGVDLEDGERDGYMQVCVRRRSFVTCRETLQCSW